MNLVNLPETLEVIGISAFCSNDLRYVTIPESVRYVSMGAFEYNGLKNVTFETNEDGTSALEVIETNAFPIYSGGGFMIGPDDPYQTYYGSRGPTITVPACKMYGYAFGSLDYLTRQFISDPDNYYGSNYSQIPRIVVTKNGDRELELSDLIVCDLLEEYNTKGNNPIQNMFSNVTNEFVETTDLPAKLPLSFYNVVTRYYPDGVLTPVGSAATYATALFIEEGTPIKALGAYAEGTNYKPYFDYFGQGDEPVIVDPDTNQNELMANMVNMLASNAPASGRTVVFTERNDLLRTVCIEEENIGTGITDTEKAAFRRSNPLDPTVTVTSMEMPYLAINNSDYEIVNNYSVVIDSGENNSYLVAAMRNQLNPDEIKTPRAVPMFDEYYYDYYNDDYTPTDEVIEVASNDTPVRLTERMPYVVLSTCELEYAGTNEPTDTPDRADRDGEPEEESIAHNPYFSFSELTEEQLEELKTEYPNLYNYIVE